MLLETETFLRSIFEACSKDQLTDIICCDHLIQAILEKCLEKRFRLIEHACWIFYETNNGFLSDKNFLGDVRIQLTKQLKHALLANRQCSVGDF